MSTETVSIGIFLFNVISTNFDLCICVTRCFMITGGVPNLGQCLKLGHLLVCIELIQNFMKTYLFNKSIL